MSNEICSLREFGPDVDVDNSYVLLRVDFNVPMDKGQIIDDYRVQKTLPLVKDIIKRGGRIIFLSHLTQKDEDRSFEPFFHMLAEICGFEFVLAKTLQEVRTLIEKKTPIILLENMRAFSGEKENEMEFAQELASLGTIFINESFSQSHRPYASIVTLPTLMPSYAGPIFCKEVTKLSELFNPERPFMVILGGMKFKTKVGVLERLTTKTDVFFVGGSIANTFLHAVGHSVGVSPVEYEEEDGIRKTFLDDARLLLPVDVLVNDHKQRDVGEVKDDERVLDAGPMTMRMIQKQVDEMSMILWNGPLGYMEKGYKKGTEDLVDMLIESSAKVILGGGDTLALLKHKKIEDKFYHISTGGGAMLTFLATGTLPGIEPLRE